MTTNMKTRYVRRSTLGQRKMPMNFDHVLVISPRSDRGSMWHLYASDDCATVQELFTDHTSYLEKNERYDYPYIKFTGFALRERGIPIYKLALVFDDDKQLDKFISKSEFSLDDIDSAEWIIHYGSARDMYLEGHTAEVEKAYHDMILGQNLLWF